MNLSIFSESFYLATNPDIAAAVAGGVISSGLQHFLDFGINEGRSGISPLFDEQFYLQNNPDVAAAVAGGFISSGLQHFLDFGLNEGRTAISSEFNEDTYLLTNQDVNTAVQSGLLDSGLEHFILFGATEGRLGAPEILIPQPAFNPASFGEAFYLQENPDVAAAVTAGVINSGLQHYQLFGQFEGRSSIFIGTSGNDIVTGFGEGNGIIGVGLEPSIFSDTGLITSEGVGEIDVLIGGDGIDVFTLGNAPLTTFSSLGNLESFLLYVGGGNNDFALIQNFEKAQDAILLSGSPEDFSLGADGGNFIISTVSGDLISIVEGQTELTAFQDPFTPGSFLLI